MKIYVTCKSILVFYLHRPKLCIKFAYIIERAHRAAVNVSLCRLSYPHGLYSLWVCALINLLGWCIG